jgi:hypothetical protein
MFNVLPQVTADYVSPLLNLLFVVSILLKSLFIQWLWTWTSEHLGTQETFIENRSTLSSHFVHLFHVVDVGHYFSYFYSWIHAHIFTVILLLAIN